MGDQAPAPCTKPVAEELLPSRPCTPLLVDSEGEELLSRAAAAKRGGGMARQEQPAGVLRELWDTKAWRVYPMMLLYVAGMTALGPLTPTLMTNFFASRAAGESLECEHLQPQPPACQNAHSEVVNWSSWTAFVSNSLLSCIMMPLVGDLSDAHGRKPFMAAAILLAAAPVAVLLLYINCGLSLLWYYPAQALQGCVSSVSISLALLADVLSPAARGPAFGGLMASFSLGIMVGPSIGGFIMLKASNGVNAAAWTAFGSCLACTLYVLLFLPDTLKQESRVQARRRLAGDSHALQSTWRAARILMRSSLFKKLTLCLMLSGSVAEGMMELLIQYLQLVADFQPGDQMVLYVLYGACALAVQAVLLPWMLKMFRERRVLSIAMASSLVQQLMLAAARAKWAGFAAVLFGSLGSVGFPAISSIKSNASLEHEQGAVQGALYGARALAMGFGPLLFAGAFRLFSRSDSSLPYAPGAPFVLGAAMMVAALYYSVSLERDGKRDGAEEHGQGAGRGRRGDAEASEEEGEGGRLLGAQPPPVAAVVL